jgi:hypothetical protein
MRRLSSSPHGRLTARRDRAFRARRPGAPLRDRRDRHRRPRVRRLLPPARAAGPLRHLRPVQRRAVPGARRDHGGQREHRRRLRPVRRALDRPAAERAVHERGARVLLRRPRDRSR